jgi:hypothetical protein
MVGGLALGVCNLQGDDLTHPVLPYRRDDEHPLTHHPPIYAHLLVASVHKQVGVGFRLQRSLPPPIELRIELAGERGDETLGEGGPAKLFGYLLDLPSRNALDVHLHKRQHQGLLVPLVARKEPSGEGAFSVLGDEQVEGAHPRPQSPSLVTVTLPRAPLGSLVGGSAYVLGHLSFQQLLKHPLYDLLEEGGLVEQHCLRDLLGPPTMVFGHLLLL